MAIKLTEWTSCGGCAAKWGASPLDGLIKTLAGEAPSLLVGLAPFDDAAVYRVSDDLAVVSTTDFFPPLVDDPADFGAVAAANACSDVFAMGGRVALALNISAFPERLPLAAVEAILAAIPQSPTDYDLARNAVDGCAVDVPDGTDCPAASVQLVVPQNTPIVQRWRFLIAECRYG